MDANSFVAVCFSDLAGQVRGHGVPRTAIADLYRRGLPWPAGLATLTAYGEAVETPWDAAGSLRLMPDSRTEVKIDFGDGEQPDSFVLGSLQTVDRTSWGGSTRNFLAATLDSLKGEFGLDLSCNYEHQFALHDDRQRPTAAMGLSALRRQRKFAGALATVLQNAGITLIRFGASAGAQQFTATTQAKFGVAAADSAIIFRQLVHATADRLGQRCSFAPQAAAPYQNRAILGIDLFDDGDQVTYDRSAADGMSATLASFIAGIWRHLPALRAVTGPALSSAFDAAPEAGAAAGPVRKAEGPDAAIVVNPDFATDVAHLRDYSFAYTAGDATACPYLQLGAIVRAGLLGLREALPAPDMRQPTAAAKTTNGGGHQLGQANGCDWLAALDEDAVLRGAFPDGLLDAYAAIKRSELATVARLSPAQLCEWSWEVY